MSKFQIGPDRKSIAAIAVLFGLSLIASDVAEAQRSGLRGGGGRAAATSIQRPSGGNLNANRNVNYNRNVNANVNRNVNVNVDHNWNGGCCGYSGYHPVARGIAFGAAAAVTAAAIGSMVHSLPPSCSPYAGSYYYCGGAYYQPRYEGTSVTYIVVEKPD